MTKKLKKAYKNQIPLDKKDINKIKRNLNKRINKYEILRFLRKILNKYIDKDVFLYSSNACYFFIMAIIPISMLIFSAISLIPNSNIDAMTAELAVLLPDMKEFSSFFSIIVNVAKGLASTSVLSMNAIFALLSSTAIIHSLAVEIRNIHGHFKDETFLRARFYSVINIFLLQAVTVFLVVLFLFGNRIMDLMKTYIPFDIKIVSDLFNLRYPIGFIVLFAFLMSIYTTSTRFKRRIKHNAIGALVSSVLWIIVSNVFSIFFTYFPINKGIYGAFSSLIIIMMWLLACMNVIFIGNIINEIIYPQKEIERKAKIDKLKSKLRLKKGV